MPNTPVVTDAAVAKLKAMVIGDQKNIFDAENIRRQAIETVKSLRANDLTRDFAAGELNGVRLFDADLTGAVLRGVSFQSASLQGVKFVRADLTGADLTNAWVKDADFSSATLSGADLSELDWFNAYGFSPAQLQSAVVGTIPECPRDTALQHSMAAFRSRLEEEYRPKWDQWSDNDRRHLQSIWSTSSKPWRVV